MVPEAPAVRQAEAKRLQARRDLAQAELDLRYCDIVSEIDGVVTSRSVNPGNHVSAGQSLMAVRSLTEIWVDANFKETQLADLRIGQRVRCEVDMYGGRQEFEGRITGFTMGTGQTLSLLPPQNATGNFVKIVQRLPVRIELTDYDPDKAPLFVGLSVAPYVYYKEPADRARTPGRSCNHWPFIRRARRTPRPHPHRPQGTSEDLMEVEFPQMLMPFMVAAVLLFGSLLVYGTAIQPDCACGGEADPKWFRRPGILEEYRRHGDRHGDHGGCAPDPDRPLGGGLSPVRAGLDPGDGLLPLRPELHGPRVWRRPAVRTVAVTRPPRGHQRPPVLRTVNGRVVRDHEPVDRRIACGPKPGTRARWPGTRRRSRSAGDTLSK